MNTHTGIARIGTNYKEASLMHATMDIILRNGIGICRVSVLVQCFAGSDRRGFENSTEQRFY